MKPIIENVNKYKTCVKPIECNQSTIRKPIIAKKKIYIEKKTQLLPLKKNCKEEENYCKEKQLPYCKENKILQRKTNN